MHCTLIGILHSPGRQSTPEPRTSVLTLWASARVGCVFQDADRRQGVPCCFTETTSSCVAVWLAGSPAEGGVWVGSGLCCCPPQGPRVVQYVDGCRSHIGTRTNRTSASQMSPTIPEEALIKTTHTNIYTNNA